MSTSSPDRGGPVPGSVARGGTAAAIRFPVLSSTQRRLSRILEVEETAAMTG
jgi:hypothetical protein